MSLADAVHTNEGPVRRIGIVCPPRPGSTDGFEFDVHTSVGSTDELIMLLLLVVEGLTEVRIDSYVNLVDQCRLVAAREQAQMDRDPEPDALPVQRCPTCTSPYPQTPFMHPDRALGGYRRCADAWHKRTDP